MIAVFAAIWMITFVFTTDLNNWLIENTLTFISLVFFVSTYRYYAFSDLSYLLICLFLCLHIYGSQYTYAENPFGYWLQNQFHTSRNHYDRLVHFASGFLQAYPLRELFVLWMGFPKKSAWMMPVLYTLAVGSLYEIIEWAVAAVFFPEQGIAYLGTQGDNWDAQKDIFWAFSGAVIASTFQSFINRITRYI